MEFQEVVRRRKMVRSFEERPLPAGALDRVLANAQRAPSAGFSQGWAFVVLEGQAQTAPFWDTVADPNWRAGRRGAGMVRAPAIVVPLAHRQAYLDRYREPDKAYANRRNEDDWPVPYWDIDTGFAVLLMLLTATDLGLGAVFFAIPQREDELVASLGVPPAYRPIGAIAIGWPAPDDPPSPSLRRGWRPSPEVVHRGGW
jgi:nitroreductase